MRYVATAAWMLALVAGIHGQTAEKSKTVERYGIESDSKKYPQSNPKETLGSVLKALGDKQYDYLLAQLADPVFVDKRVSAFMTQLGPDLTEAQKRSLAFNRLVRFIADEFQEDPTKTTDLQRFLKDGEWTEDGNDAVCSLKGLQARRVFMKRIAPERWILLDREK